MIEMRPSSAENTPSDAKVRAALLPVVIRLADMPDVVVAIVHFETQAGRVIALRTNRDPKRISWLGVDAPISASPAR